MTTEFVLAYVPRKMRESGHGDNYVLAFRELVIRAGQKITLKAAGQYYYLVGLGSSAAGVPVSSILLRVESESGVYDSFDGTINEMQYEHTGNITMENLGAATLFAKFIVAVPNKKR